MEPLIFGSVRVWLGEKSGKYPDGNQVMVRGTQMQVALDTPKVARRLLPQLRQADLIVLSHAHEDHMVALGALPQVPVQVHERDLAAVQSWEGLRAHYGYPPQVLDAMLPWLQQDFDYAPRPDATAFADGACWDLGGGVRMRAHHFPGHTSGHCALVVENEGLAFIGDIDLSGFGPYYGDATSSLAEFRDTLRRLRDLDARIWVTSHHRGVITERAQFLDWLDRFAGKLDEHNEKLLGYLADGPQTLQQLAARRLLYPPQASLPYVEPVERRSIAQHLAELQQRGQVLQDETGAWRLA